MKIKLAIAPIIIVIVAGCAGKTALRISDQSRVTPPLPKAENDLSGNTLSLWVDRTPALRSSWGLPSAGEDCAMIYDPTKHRLILFGGKNNDDQNLNEVWTFDFAQNTWQKFQVEGESPPSCEDHAVIYDPIGYRMIVHGGENGPAWNHTWALDLTTRRWRNITDSTAPAREDHTAIFDSRNKRLVIFGGRDGDYIDFYGLSTLALDPSSPAFEKWQSLTATKKHPPGRSDHVAVFDSLQNRMIIYGGWSHEKGEYLDDTWAFYFATPPDTAGRWKQIKAKKSHPPKRRHAVGVYDSARNWFIICGGFGQEGYLNDVWAFDLSLDEWINVTPGPQPRIDHQAIYDPKSRRLILYGGDARLKTKFHDLWELQILPGVSAAALRPEPATKISERD
jgi:hypothetical protein